MTAGVVQSYLCAGLVSDISSLVMLLTIKRRAGFDYGSSKRQQPHRPQVSAIVQHQRSGLRA
jgi:hypothetical protein